MVEAGFLPVVKIGASKNATLYFRKSVIDAAFQPTPAA
jgi:hypothetical protein